MTRTVYVIDDHPVVREGLRMLLDSSDDVRVIGGAASVRGALAELRDRSPDVVLLDLDLGEEDGLEALPRVVAAAPRARVLILTALRDRVHDEAAIRAGARGLVLKDASPQVLLQAIRTVAGGELWFDARVLESLASGQGRREERRPGASPPPQAGGAGQGGAAAAQAGAGPLASLTPRERDIVVLVSEGLRNQEVARRLGISDKTVRNHLTLVFDKLGVSGRLELVAFAHQHGLSAQHRR